tara:strand:- start:900 stop:1892 length:993 start_codon:yes stop_codon:yes gene_type:complete
MQLTKCELQSDWERGDVYSKLGVVQLRLGRFWSASSSFQRALHHTNRQHGLALEFLGLLHYANGRIQQGDLLHRELLDNIHLKINLKQKNRVLGRLERRKNTNNNVNNDNNVNNLQVQEAQYELCDGLLTHVRHSWLARGAHLTMDDYEVSEIFQKMTSYDINVFENEKVEDVVSVFCKERNWEYNSSQCTTMRTNLLNEEKRMRFNNGARGAIRYKLELDNSIYIPFNVDGNDYNVTLGPSEDASVVTKDTCQLSGLKQEDCVTLGKDYVICKICLQLSIGYLNTILLFFFFLLAPIQKIKVQHILTLLFFLFFFFRFCFFSLCKNNTY